jgi:hypothetical protein
MVVLADEDGLQGGDQTTPMAREGSLRPLAIRAQPVRPLAAE